MTRPGYGPVADDAASIPQLEETSKAIAHEKENLSFYRWSWVGRRWIRHPDPEMFTCASALPAHSLHQWPIEPDGALVLKWALYHTGATIVALVRVQYDRRFALLWIGYEYVAHASFYAPIAANADPLVKDHRSVGRNQIGNGVRF